MWICSLLLETRNGDFSPQLPNSCHGSGFRLLEFCLLDIFLVDLLLTITFVMTGSGRTTTLLLQVYICLPQGNTATGSGISALDDILEVNTRWWKWTAEAFSGIVLPGRRKDIAGCPRPRRNN
ncbi:hypothetical protein CONLIGDRAFT_252732 [Coniochaeta ligniaria NRRL 30616]|uniref:Uncharacterized protein n=1 Tax=Coniochaeta ligniaria NRRL 30616 TaxID=1408157 RepID=A0A1J7IX86_9PEZI|nr:hypothetical protein CONLIGDRAFT_252732 [Coniochaeta ligniaria NRRL 30616]